MYLTHFIRITANILIYKQETITNLFTVNSLSWSYWLCGALSRIEIQRLLQYQFHWYTFALVKYRSMAAVIFLFSTIHRKQLIVTRNLYLRTMVALYVKYVSSNESCFWIVAPSGESKYKICYRTTSCSNNRPRPIVIKFSTIKTHTGVFQKSYQDCYSPGLKYTFFLFGCLEYSGRRGVHVNMPATDRREIRIMSFWFNPVTRCS